MSSLFKLCFKAKISCRQFKFAWAACSCSLSVTGDTCCTVTLHPFRLKQGNWPYCLIRRKKSTVNKIHDRKPNIVAIFILLHVTHLFRYGTWWYESLSWAASLASRLDDVNNTIEVVSVKTAIKMLQVLVELVNFCCRSKTSVRNRISVTKYDTPVVTKNVVSVTVVLATSLT